MKNKDDNDALSTALEASSYIAGKAATKGVGYVKGVAGAASKGPLYLAAMAAGKVLEAKDANAIDNEDEMKKGKKYLDDNEQKDAREEMKKGMTKAEKAALLQEEEEDAMVKAFKGKRK